MVYCSTTKIKSIGANEVLNNENKLAAQPDASNSSIPKTTENATQNPKLSLGDDITPSGKWNVKGSDIVLDDTTPIRKDIVPAQNNEVYEEWSEYEPDSLTEGPFAMQEEEITSEDDEIINFRKANVSKIKNIQAKIQGLQVSRDVTKKKFT